MKMTPRDKAFYEYGQEYKDMMICRWEYNAGVCARINLEARIRRAWKKRAACRAWTIPSHERICENCHNEYVPCYLPPCNKCYRSPFVNNYEGFNDKWEPKKEGQ